MAKGWAKIDNRGKYHFYKDDGGSLCGKYRVMFVPESAFENARDEHEENCKECMRRIAKYRLKS